jgi:6,7-dimethyl-8-ribityllumazine synthase
MASKGNFNMPAIQARGFSLESISVVIVRTQWNATILDELEKGCKEKLMQAGVKDIRVITVPGVVEIPFAVKQYWEAYKYRDDKPAAFIALGCVIQGDTPHFDHVCNIVTHGTLQLNLCLPIPTIFGILTVLNETQAWERLGGKHGHKGEEAAITALSMIELAQSFRKRT